MLPTPYYNAGIVQDMLMLEHSKILKKIAKNAPRLIEASILLRVWAQRHQLLDGADGVDGFFLTNLLAQLLQSGKAVGSFYYILNIYFYFLFLFLVFSGRLLIFSPLVSIIFPCSLLE